MRLLYLTAGLVCAILIPFPPATHQQDWPQWGGPNRNFKIDSVELADQWPSNGPRELWRRPLGEGYSGAAVVGETLYTMLHRGSDEVVTAIHTTDGKTRWEFAYPAPAGPQYNFEYGPGPHVTPLVTGGRVFTVGATGIFHCLDSESGQPLWSHNLVEDFGGTLRNRGYSASPLAYQDQVIVTVGEAGQSVMAFKQSDGSVVWQAQDFVNSPSSPILIQVDGQEQLIVFMAEQVAGLNPSNGALYWSHPHTPQFGLNISLPVWSPDHNILFISSAYGGGSKGLRLSHTGQATEVRELWSTQRMRVHFGTAIRIGDYVYASSGDFGPAPFTAINLETGELAWRSRELTKASSILADGKLIILTEDGELVLATVSPEKLTIHSRHELFNSRSWTVPTLTGKSLFARNRQELVAMELP